jgi:hypothetical protein
MAYRFKEQYGAVLKKREALRNAEAFSDPDEPGSKVSILVPFMEELITEHDLDSRENFEKQTDRLIDYYTARGQDPYPIMDAKREDFERVLADKSISTVVTAGFGNFSAIAVALPREESQPFRYGYLDWLHLAGMATHLKLGKFVALHCGGYYRQFNPPLAAGVQSSYRDIIASLGRGRYATGDWEEETEPATTKDELTYEEVRELYPMRKRQGIPDAADAAYVALRGIREQMRNPDFPRPEKIPYPDEMRQYVV